MLIICTGNSMRSQMGEGLLRHDLGDYIDVYSAGTHPSYVHPLAIEALAGLSYDASGHRSKSVDEFTGRKMDLVITVCDHAREVCPIFPGARRTIHKGYPDPTSIKPGRDPSEVMAELRDQMRVELRELVIRELNLQVRL